MRDSPQSIAAVSAELAGAVASETIKLRRSPAVWVSIAAPLALVLVFLLAFMALGPRNTTAMAGTNPWLAMENTLFFWSACVLPLVVTVQSALIVQLEHAEHMWKHLLALPVDRWVFPVSKMVILLALAAVASAVLWVSLLLSGAVLWAVDPVFRVGPAHGWELLQSIVSIYIASWWLASVQLAFALYRSEFALPVLTGMLATLGCLFVLGGRATPGLWAHLYPWGLPFQVWKSGVAEAAVPLRFSVGGAVGVLGLTCYCFGRRDCPW